MPRLRPFASPARSLRLVALGLVVTLAAASCGDDGGDDVTAPPPVSYPPAGVDELAPIFDPELEALGLRLTRGDLIDRSEGGYVLSPTGDHLALYVEPIDETSYSTADYVEGLETITALVTPMVFERYTALDSYDICQEPPNEVDDSVAPTPYTQIEYTRAQSDAVDWDAFTLDELLSSTTEADGPRVVATGPILEHPDYQAALEASA